MPPAMEHDQVARILHHVSHPVLRPQEVRHIPTIRPHHIPLGEGSRTRQPPHRRRDSTVTGRNGSDELVCCDSVATIATVNPHPRSEGFLYIYTPHFMFQFEANGAVILESQKVLEQALSTNPKTQKALQKLIQKVIREARAKVVPIARHAMKSDPRGASRAIRTTVYKQVLGANINIYNSRKAHGSSSYEPPRKLRPKQRGGNRVPRGERTNTVMHYDALDRGFILRFLNSGTTEREAGTRNGRLHGNRGSISARHFFRGAGERALVQAADNLANLIDTELDNILNKQK